MGHVRTAYASTKGGSQVEGIPGDKMKELSKAISHYLNGEYGKIMDEEEGVGGIVEGL